MEVGQGGNIFVFCNIIEIFFFLKKFLIKLIFQVWWFFYKIGYIFVIYSWDDRYKQLDFELFDKLKY